MATLYKSIVMHLRRFWLTIVLLAIVASIQVAMSWHKIEGYPDNLWSSYFIKWWLCATPFIALGIWLITLGSSAGTNRKGIAYNVAGKAVLSLATLALYVSLLAIG